MRGSLSILVAAGLVLGALLASTSGAAQQLKPGAHAQLTGGTVGARAEARAGGTAENRNAGAVAAPGVQVREGETLATTAVAAGTARASAVARTVSLLDGRITAYGVRRTAEATASGRTFSGRIEGLVVDGRTIGTVTRPRSFRLADGAGRVFVNTGTSGLRLELAVAAGPLPGRLRRPHRDRRRRRAGRRGRADRDADPRPDGDTDAVVAHEAVRRQGAHHRSQAPQGPEGRPRG